MKQNVVKKSLAVTLILALGLLPGAPAWSQTYSGRVAPVTTIVGAQAGVAQIGGQALGPVLSGLTVNSLNAATPVLSAPALALVALAAVPSAVIPSPYVAAAQAAKTAPVAASEAASIRAQFDAVSGAFLEGEASRAGKAESVEIVRLGKMFDGSSAYAPEVRGAPSFDESALRGRSVRPALSRPSALAPAAVNQTQQRMLTSLYQVASIFAEQYAPLDLKKDKLSLDLKREYDKAKAAILANPALTIREYQDLLAKLVASMRDYHVSISFHSTESSKLPFLVTGAGGKYFLTYIDREKLPLEKFPFEMGDEVVTFDGQPTAAAVQAIAGRMTANTAETDMRMAEIFLTNRRRARGDNDIPSGVAELVILRDGLAYRVRMPWTYTPELVAQDVPLRNVGLLEPEGAAGISSAGGGGIMRSVANAFNAAVHPLVELFSQLRNEASDNTFMIGARKSFVPQLGKVLWRSDEDSHFDAYIFETEGGMRKGYIRIADYDGDYAEVQEFAKIMAKFQVETDALVIDQVSNPGGSVFYLYALASHLTDKPLMAPRHRLIIGEAEAHQSAEVLLKFARDSQKPAKEEKKIKEGKEDEPPNVGGYPITEKFISLMLRSARFILQQFNAGKRYTDLIHISGVADIDPAPKAEERYTKPILLLTNALDFSGGDFFPAIMQDNKRATIMGVRTAGAGGIVKSYDVDQLGIDHLSATGSLAQRPNGQPIENLGVTPDIPYEITQKDLRTGFAQYRYNILKALRAMTEGAK